MDRSEWLEERRKGIGGSDAGAVVGLSKYKNSFDVYADKLGLIGPKEDNEAMRQGRDLEEYVAERFCEETGKKVRRKNSIIKNPKYPFALANVDRMICGENAGLECKTANILSLKRYRNGEYPEEYYCQCMHYMAVTGAEKWYLAVLIFGKEFKVFEIKRDEDEIYALMQAEKDFWENHVEKREPPMPEGTDSNDDVIDALYPSSDGGELVFSSDSLFSEYQEKKALIKKLESDKKKIEQKIKMVMGECEYAHSRRFKASWKNAVRYTIDREKLEKDIDISGYLKETNYRIFKVQEEE